MDRLETEKGRNITKNVKKFTFQYGQIRNLIDSQIRIYFKKIYIPVWIDQKLDMLISQLAKKDEFTFQYGQIRNIF